MQVLVIPDTHAPFHHPDTLDFLASLRRKHKPEVVVHIGDLGDQHGWSRHDRQPDAPGQADEDSACLRFCKQLYKLFPKVKACIGNHDTRVAKAAVRAGLPSRLVADVAEVYDSPRGWEWKIGFKIDGVLYEHGDSMRGAEPAFMAAKILGMSVAIGHHHSQGGVRWFQTRYDRRFGLSVGCLVDPESLATAYGQNFLLKPMLGAGLIIDGVPQFAPMG